MLPRLRFVIAAALIAALPWLVFGSGLLPAAPNSPVNELTRQGTGMNVSASDARDAHHQHLLAYVRRSRELDRLRELGNAPLSEWVAAPAGKEEAPRTLAPEPPLPEKKIDVAAAASAPIAEPTPSPEPPVTQAAAEPPRVEPALPDRHEPVMTAALPQDAETIEPTFNVTPGLVPRLPRARPHGEVLQPVKRRVRPRAFAARPQNFPFGTPPSQVGVPNNGFHSRSP